MTTKTDNSEQPNKNPIRRLWQSVPRKWRLLSGFLLTTVLAYGVARIALTLFLFSLISALVFGLMQGCHSVVDPFNDLH
jgi:hypothetical protein